MADIFLSYTEKDRDIARRVAAMLGSAGWTVWWDRRIPAGESWRSVLEQALQNMRCMIVLWSAHSIESEWMATRERWWNSRANSWPTGFRAKREMFTRT